MKKSDFELIKKWMLYAVHDLDTAKIINLHLKDYKETICYHCQQAVEKALKAYLIYLEIDFKKSHSLEYLLNLIGLKDEFSDEWYEMASKLENYAVEIRYPDVAVFPSDEEIINAIEIAEKFHNLILEKIKT